VGAKPAKQTAWRWMSAYIRLRDALETMDSTEYARCVTCGSVHHIKSMDAGHFVPGRTDGALWDERNCHAQCKRCNKYLGGNLVEYRPFMLHRYGQDVIDELWRNARSPVKHTESDYRALAARYRDKYRALEREYA